jgi:hypothetical protein
MDNPSRIGVLTGKVIDPFGNSQFFIKSDFCDFTYLCSIKNIVGWEPYMGSLATVRFRLGGLWGLVLDTLPCNYSAVENLFLQDSYAWCWDSTKQLLVVNPYTEQYIKLVCIKPVATRAFAYVSVSSPPDLLNNSLVVGTERSYWSKGILGPLDEVFAVWLSLCIAPSPVKEGYEYWPIQYSTL